MPRRGPPGTHRASLLEVDPGVAAVVASEALAAVCRRPLLPLWSMPSTWHAFARTELALIGRALLLATRPWPVVAARLLSRALREDGLHVALQSPARA